MSPTRAERVTRRRRRRVPRSAARPRPSSRRGARPRRRRARPRGDRARVRPREGLRLRIRLHVRGRYFDLHRPRARRVSRPSWTPPRPASPWISPPRVRPPRAPTPAGRRVWAPSPRRVGALRLSRGGGGFHGGGGEIRGAVRSVDSRRERARRLDASAPSPRRAAVARAWRRPPPPPRRSSPRASTLAAARRIFGTVRRTSCSRRARSRCSRPRRDAPSPAPRWCLQRDPPLAQRAPRSVTASSIPKRSAIATRDRPGPPQ